MLTHAELVDQLGKLDNADVLVNQDRVNSISSKVIRCRYEGQQAVAVGANLAPRYRSRRCSICSTYISRLR